MKISQVRERVPKAALAAIALVMFYLPIRYGVWLIAAAIAAWLVTGNEAVYDYIKGCGKALDQACNALLGGHHKEVVSSRIGKTIYLHHKFPQIVPRVPLWMRAIRRAMDRIEAQHVFKAIEPEPGFRLLPEQKDEAIELARKGEL